jgi:hypothetical protein
MAKVVPVAPETPSPPPPPPAPPAPEAPTPAAPDVEAPPAPVPAPDEEAQSSRFSSATARFEWGAPSNDKAGACAFLTLGFWICAVFFLLSVIFLSEAGKMKVEACPATAAAVSGYSTTVCQDNSTARVVPTIQLELMNTRTASVGMIMAIVGGSFGVPICCVGFGRTRRGDTSVPSQVALMVAAMGVFGFYMLMFTAELVCATPTCPPGTHDTRVGNGWVACVTDSAPAAYVYPYYVPCTYFPWEMVGSVTLFSMYDALLVACALFV